MSHRNILLILLMCCWPESALANNPVLFDANPELVSWFGPRMRGKEIKDLDRHNHPAIDLDIGPRAVVTAKKAGTIAEINFGAYVTGHERYGFSIEILDDEGRRWRYSHLFNDSCGIRARNNGFALCDYEDAPKKEHRWAIAYKNGQYEIIPPGSETGLKVGTRVQAGTALAMKGVSGLKPGRGSHLDLTVFYPSEKDGDYTNTINPLLFFPVTMGNDPIPGSDVLAPTNPMAFVYPGPDSMHTDKYVRAVLSIYDTAYNVGGIEMRIFPGRVDNPSSEAFSAGKLLNFCRALDPNCDTLGNFTFKFGSQQHLLSFSKDWTLLAKK